MEDLQKVRDYVAKGYIRSDGTSPWITANEYNNGLIAEFMGVVFHDDENQYYSSDGIYIGDTLQYHTSWDWLMPVIKKCFCTRDNTFEWDAIMDAMWTCDRKIVHSVVVEFINQNNEYNEIERRQMEL